VTIDHPIRRALARICSAQTMSTVVDPTLADIRWERTRPRWRGYVSLARALSVHAVTSMPAALAHVVSDDGGAMAKLCALSAGVAVVFALPLIARPLIAFPISPAIAANISRPRLFALLLPQALALTIPAALLAVVPLVMHRVTPSRRLIGRILLLSVLYAAITFGMIGWVVPAANQAFRTTVSGMSNLARGPSESSFTHMRSEIARLQTFHGGQRLVREMSFEYEMRIALSAAAIPLAMLAVAFALSGIGRNRPVITGAASLALYIAVLFAFESTVARPLLMRTTVNVGTIAWIPNASIVLLAGWIAAATLRPRNSPLRS
jgi:hypothetical protein